MSRSIPVAVALGAIPLIVVTAMFLLQERLLFPGAFGLPDDPIQRAADAATVGADPVAIATPSGDRILTWHYDHGADRLVIYVGGNFQPIEASVRIAPTLADHGWNLLAVAPRGWPGSEGTPGEAAFREDVHAAWTHATTTLGVPPGRIVLHGRSMGGGAIGTVIHELPAAGAVFESTFDSVVPLAQGAYPFLPIGLLLKHRFDTVGRAPRAPFPVFQVHSVDDEVIPVARARTLAEAWRDGTYVELQGPGHQDVPLVTDAPTRDAWMQWLDAAVPQGVP